MVGVGAPPSERSTTNATYTYKQRPLACQVCGVYLRMAIVQPSHARPWRGTQVRPVHFKWYVALQQSQVTGKSARVSLFLGSGWSHLYHTEGVVAAEEDVAAVALEEEDVASGLDGVGRLGFAFLCVNGDGASLRSWEMGALAGVAGAANTRFLYVRFCCCSWWG